MTLIEQQLFNLRSERAIALARLDFLIARIDVLEKGIIELEKQQTENKDEEINNG